MIASYNREGTSLGFCISRTGHCDHCRVNSALDCWNIIYAKQLCQLTTCCQTFSSSLSGSLFDKHTERTFIGVAQKAPLICLLQLYRRVIRHHYYTILLQRYRFTAMPTRSPPPSPAPVGFPLTTDFPQTFPRAISTAFPPPARCPPTLEWHTGTRITMHRYNSNGEWRQ